MEGGKFNGKKTNRVQRQKNLPFFPPSFFGWFNNKMDIRQINRRKTNLILYAWEPHKKMTCEEVIKQEATLW